MNAKFKKSLIALAAVVAVGAGMSTAIARPGAGPDEGARVEFMAKKLQLTPDQQAQMKTLFEEQRQLREQMRATMQDRMKNILTQEQFAKLEDMREQRMERMERNRGNDRGPGMGRGCERGQGQPRSAGPQASL
ncbi:MAG: Spy/CpxP family protein refolding chaperone [Pseudomonadota bacterium]